MTDIIENIKNNKQVMIMLVILAAILLSTGVMKLMNTAASSESGDAQTSSGDASADASGNASGSKITVTKETLSSTVETPCFQIGSTTLYVGEATVQDLVDAGAVFNEESEASVVEFSEDPLQERELEFTVSDTTLCVTVQNPLDEIAQLKDSVVTSAYWDGYSVAGTAGVVIGDSLETLLEKAGEPYAIINSEDYDDEIGSLPSTSRVYMYCDEIDHAVLLATVDRNTYLVNHIEEVSAGVCVTDASKVTLSQMQYLVDDYFSNHNEITTASYVSEDGVKTSGTVSGIYFSQVQVAVIRDFESSDEAADFYDVSSNGYMYSSVLFVECSATVSFTDGSTRTGYGGFIVYDPIVDGAGNIVSGSGKSYSTLSSTLYSSPSLFAEEALEPTAYYAIDFSADDYVITTNAFSSESADAQ